jgi:hypothetical protein
MRPGQQNKRMRGRGRRGPSPLSRSYESNGPDVKIRGTAAHIAEKYAQLGRDATASGDPVLAESYFQHAEHYFRIIAAAQAQFQQQNPNEPQPQRFRYNGMDDDDDDDDLTGEPLRPEPVRAEPTRLDPVRGEGPQPYVQPEAPELPLDARSQEAEEAPAKPAAEDRAGHAAGNGTVSPRRRRRRSTAAATEAGESVRSTNGNGAAEAAAAGGEMNDA